MRHPRLAIHPQWLLLPCTIVVIAAQLACQLQYATQGWYTKWPTAWDQNRYTDMAFFYGDAFDTGGVNGLVRAYQRRPPYSVTLLATSLPAFLVHRDFSTLYFHLACYVILMDLGLFGITYRLTRSLTLSQIAVLAAHFGTTGIVSSSTLAETAECVRYQLNYPGVAMTIIGLALLVEGCYTKRPLIWAILLSIACLGSFLLRGAAVPYFLVVLVPPAGWLCAVNWFNGRRKAAVLGFLAVSLAVTLTGLHVYYSWSRLLWYVRHAQSDPRFQARSTYDSLTYYLGRCLADSPIFAYCVVVVVAGALLFLPRIAAPFLGRRQTPWRLRRIVLAHSLVAYVWAVSLVLPTLSPAKNARLGDTFLMLTPAIAMVSLRTLARLCSRRWRLIANARPSLSIVALAAILFNCGIGDFRDISRARAELADGERDSQKQVKQRQRMVYHACVAFLGERLREKQRLSILVGFVGQTHMVYETHTFRIIRYSEKSPRVRIECRHSWSRPQDILQGPVTENRMAEVLFVPGRTDGTRSTAEFGQFNFEPIHPNDRESIVRCLTEAGYTLVATLPLTDGFCLDAYEYKHRIDVPADYGYP